MTSTQTDPAASPAEPTAGDILYLTRRDVRAAMGTSIRGYVEALRAALALHAEGKTAQPLKPYLRWRTDGHIADRIIAMPGYVGGAERDGRDQVDRLQARQPEGAGHPARERGDRAQRPGDALPDRDHGGRRDQRHAHRRRERARREYLARSGFGSVALVGCGFIGRLHALGLLESFPAIERVHLYDHDRRRGEGARGRAGALDRERLTAIVAETAEEAVCHGELVVRAR